MLFLDVIACDKHYATVPGDCVRDEMFKSAAVLLCACPAGDSVE